MRIVITGASGYVGGHICRTLQQDHDVFSIGRNNATFPCHLDASPDFIPKIGNVDAIIHCAADPDPRNPNSLFTNARMTHNLLEAYKSRTRYFIFLSSLKVYGSVSNVVSEEAKVNPACIYGVSKATEEHLIRIYSEQYDFTPVIYRLGTVVGGNMTHGILRDFKERAENYEGGGFTIRSVKPGSMKPYVHVEDVVDAIKMFPVLEGVYNVCPPDTITDYWLAQNVKRYYNIEDENVFTDEVWPMETRQMWASPAKLESSGWKRKYNMSIDAIRGAI